MTDPVPLDMAKLLAEIDQEVERRRTTGELPRDLERELDTIFDEFAPVDASNADFDNIVAKIERSAVIDIRPPTVSAYPGAAQMKQVVAKATAFSLRHVTSQVSGLFQAVARALRLEGARVDRLEAERDRREDARHRLEAHPEARWSATATDRWDDFVIEQLEASPGRVLHAHGADGRLVRRLLDAGLDAYGVEPSEAEALAASDLVPDIRSVEVADHLATLPPATLGGLVLSGFVERLDIASLVHLVELAASRLALGGTVVVVSAHPASWAHGATPVAVDLSEGGPVHPETWLVMLRQAGFVDPAVRLGARPEMTVVPSTGPSELGSLAALAQACNENFARLAEAALGPAEFAVRARRP